MTRLSILLAGVLIAACADSPPQAPEAPALPPGVVELDAAQLAEVDLTIDTVTLRELAVPIDVAGTIAAPDHATAHVGAVAEGRVVKVTVLPGQKVRAGETLAILHSRDFAAARRDLLAATAREKTARAAVERSQNLVSVGAVSREEVEQREAALAAAEAEVARTADMAAQLDRGNDNLSVVAPHDGVVLAVHAHVGEAVVVGQPLVDLADIRTLWVTGWVPERAVPSLARGGDATVVLAAFPGDSFAGKVVQIGGALDPVRRAVDVRVALVSPPPGLLPGMFATLILPTADRALRAVLPAAAVQRSATGEGVYLRESQNRFRFVPVTSARVQPDGTVAVEGLPAGGEVVTTGAFRLRAIAEVGEGEGGHAH